MTAADRQRRPPRGRALRERPAHWLHAADRLQQRRPVLAITVAIWRKFSDDQAGKLAALVAYYAFASIFPLLLVLVTVLDLVIRNNPSLKQQLLDSAFGQYPVIGADLKSNVHPISATGVALVIGLVLTLYGARGIAMALQNALNTVWGVPQYRRPAFPKSLLRSLGIIAVIGPGEIITITLSSIAGGTGHLGGGAAKAAAIAVSLLLNVGLFWLAFRIATAAEVAARDLRLSAILAATGWQVLQLIGGYLVGHQLKTNSVYGVFGVVLGLLAWFYLQAQITLYAVELNVVRVKRLWPRSLAPPPLVEADLDVYQLQATANLRRPELEVEVREARDARDGPPAEPDAGPAEAQ
jgi:membrane protein